MFKRIESQENESMIPVESGEQKFTKQGPDFDKSVANVNASFDWDADTWEKMLGWDLSGGDIMYDSEKGIWLNDKLKNIGLASSDLTHIDKLKNLMGITGWKDFLVLVTDKNKDNVPARLNLLKSVFYVSADKNLSDNQLKSIATLSSVFGYGTYEEMSNKAMLSTASPEDATINAGKKFFDSVLAPYYKLNGVNFDQKTVYGKIENYINSASIYDIGMDYKTFMNKNGIEAAGRF